MKSPLIQQILAMPNAFLFLSEIQQFLEKERAQRLHFYEIVDENKKMEFINGEIVFHSPVMMRHNTVTGLLYKLVNTFAHLHKAGFVGIEKIMISLTRNDYEPDICFFPEEAAKNFTPTQMRFPAPAWIAEILSKSTENNDRGIKFQDYAAHGVQEYWIVNPEDETVEQYVLHENDYRLALKSKEGTISSFVLKGFTIPVRAVFDADENVRALHNLLSRQV